LLLANAEAASQIGLTARARVIGMDTAGVPPRVMGIGPAPAVRKLLRQTGMTLDQFDVIELNEAFASQGLAVLRLLGLRDDDPRINPNGGAIALGHLLGMSGARLVTTAMYQLQRTNGQFAPYTMCIGGGAGHCLCLGASLRARHVDRCRADVSTHLAVARQPMSSFWVETRRP
jgi:acetyl-CoA acyltransferase